LIEERQEKERRCEGEVRTCPESGSRDRVTLSFQKEQKRGGDGDGARDCRRRLVVEEGESEAGEDEDDSEGWKVFERVTCDRVGGLFGGAIVVLPGVDEQAVEAAQSCEEERGRQQG